MKIDIFTHIMTEKWWKAVCKKYKSVAEDRIAARMANNLDIRFRAMERTPEVLQVLTNNVLPPLEAVVTPADSVELCRIANDEMAEVVLKYPDKFLGAVACLPLGDMDAALEETDRAITQLGFKGVEVVARLFGEQLDDPKYIPLYEKMAKYDLPIWIHPCHSYPEDKSPNSIDVLPYALLAWPLATSINMMRLVCAGIFNDYPDIKFITHHCGGVVPYLEGRVKWLYDGGFEIGDPARKWKEHFRKFYNDTAAMGSTATLMCGYDFFGADHLLFGTDGLTMETINSINRMDIPDAEKEKIFSGNAISLLNIQT